MWVLYTVRLIFHQRQNIHQLIHTYQSIHCFLYRLYWGIDQWCKMEKSQLQGNQMTKMWNGSILDVRIGFLRFIMKAALHERNFPFLIFQIWFNDFIQDGRAILQLVKWVVNTVNITSSWCNASFIFVYCWIVLFIEILIHPKKWVPWNCYKRLWDWTQVVEC